MKWEEQSTAQFITDKGFYQYDTLCVCMVNSPKIELLSFKGELLGFVDISTIS